MKKIWLIRHGQTDYNADNKIQGSGIDAPLNALGLLQAGLVANALEEKLTGQTVTLFASSLIRAKQTASAISEKMHLAVSTSNAIVELNFGVLEGLPIDQIEQQLNNLLDCWDSGKTTMAALDGESPETAFARASSFIEKAVESSTTENCIFVVHGRLLRILLAGWLDKDLSKMANYHHHNANINLLDYDGGRFKVVVLNDITHLLSLDSQ